MNIEKSERIGYIKSRAQYLRTASQNSEVREGSNLILQTIEANADYLEIESLYMQLQSVLVDDVLRTSRSGV